MGESRTCDCWEADGRVTTGLAEPERQACSKHGVLSPSEMPDPQRARTRSVPGLPGVKQDI